MARPRLEYRGSREERRKRGQEARERVLSGQSRVEQERPVLTYKDPEKAVKEATYTARHNANEVRLSQPAPKPTSIQPDYLKPQQMPLTSMQTIKDFQTKAPLPPQKGINERLGDQLREVPVLGSIYKGLDKLQKFTEPAAKVAQEFYTPGAGLSALGAAERGAMNLVSRVAPKLPSLVNRGLAEGAIGAYAGAGQSLAANPEEGLTGAAKGAGVGGLGGAALPFVGKGVKMASDKTGLTGALTKLFKRNGIADDVASKEVENILALPMGRADAARLRRAPQGGVDGPIVNPYTFALPEPRMPQPAATSARIGQRANPWREKYNQLIGLAHETKFTPGKELEELESLWSQIADREDPSLDDLIKLAHPTYVNKVEPGLASKARNYQSARDVAGAPLPIKRTEPIPQGVVSDAAPLTQKVGRAPNVKKPIEEPVMTVAATPSVNPPKAEQPLQKSEPTTAHEPDDVADDLVPDEPDEVSIRVRDKVNNFADKLIAEAMAGIKNSNRLSSNPVDVYGKLIAGYMLKGTVKLADLTEAIVRDFGEGIRPHIKANFKKAKEEYKRMKQEIESEELGIKDIDVTTLKDRTNLNFNTADVYRNFANVFGKQLPKVKESILDPFDNAKGEYVQEQKTLTDRLYKEIVKDLGIKKGSKDSALVQKYGEGQITLDELKAAAPGKWKSIVKADKWFRTEYDAIIERVNESVKKIYPNRPEKLVPKRDDYYRHFQDLSGWSGIKNLFDTASGRISPQLAGLSPFTQPKTKWASFKQKRGMGEFKNDAVGGFLDYVPAASYAIHIDPHISVFRNLANHLRTQTEKTGNLNVFIRYLENFANDLSGKQHSMDRWVEDIGGRNGLRLLVKFNNRVKSNVIVGNARSALAQLASIPNGVAFSAVDSPMGAWRTIESLYKPNEAMSKSKFLSERFLDKSFRRFDQKWWQQPKRFAEWTMELMDRIGTSFVWNTAYARGVRQKVEDPIRYADENTRKLVAGRGVGEQPLMFKSKVVNVIAPFQLEVNNLWRVIKDFVDEKRFGALISLFGANFVLNKAFEQLTGNRIVFDPINAIYEASKEKDVNVFERMGRVGGEVISNTPFGGHLASLYPEYGFNLSGIDFPTRKGLFGDNDPTRFGTGPLAVRGVTDPIFMFVLPFGGNQVKKTIQGGDALSRGGSYTENILTTGIKNENPKLKFPVKPTLGNATKSLLFGPYATKEGHKYTKDKQRPLSEKQTTLYKAAPEKEKFLDILQIKRESDSLKAKIGEVFKDDKLSEAKKKAKITELESRILKLQSGLSQ